MKKLYTILALITLAVSAQAQFVHTNYAAVDAYEITGNFDSYSWDWIGQDSQTVMYDIDFSSSDADLSSSTLGWKMSRETATGKVDYVIISATNITSTGTAGRVTFAVTNTAIPPDATYKSELFAYQGSNSNLTRTLAQGLVDVRQSLYEDDSLFSYPSTTGLVEYVRKDGDFSQMTGLGGTVGQVYASDGDGTGTWTTDGGGDITAVVAGTGLTGGGASGSVTVSQDSATIASLDLADGSLQSDGSVDAASLQFSGGTGTQGTMSWNDTEETVDLICDGAVLQMGQELYWHVRNNSGSVISNGVVCGATGTIGATGRMTVGKFLADGNTDAMFLIGVATEEIANGENGKVSAFGKVRDIDTSAWDEGAVLYPSSTVAGGFTTNAPASPAIASPIGFVLTKHANQGTIAVRVHPADDNEFATYAQGALADSAVQPVGTPVDNQVGVWTGDGTLEGDASLTYDGTKIFLNKSVNAPLQLKLQNQDTGVNGSCQVEMQAHGNNLFLINYGSGVADLNDVSRLWTTASSTSLRLGTEAIDVISIDAAQNVGIGTNSPSVKLEVVGDTKVTGELLLGGIADQGAYDLQVPDAIVTNALHIPNMKTGTTQGGAGAVAGELWADSDDDYTVKLGQ